MVEKKLNNHFVTILGGPAERRPTTLVLRIDLDALVE
jgi:hypothetical protein